MSTTVLDSPDMEATHYGIPVTHIGEDGEMLALGHHRDLRALAAFNRHARVFVGLANLADDRSASADDWLIGIRQSWAVFSLPNPDEGDDPDFTWMVHEVPQETPNARPVTYLDH